MGSVLQYKTFNLFIIRSVSFGSNKNNFKYFHYAYLKIKLAISINSLAHYAKGTLLLKL